MCPLLHQPQCYLLPVRTNISHWMFCFITVSVISQSMVSETQGNWINELGCFSKTVVSNQITGKNIDPWPQQSWIPSSGLNEQKFECCKLFKKKEDIGSLPSLPSFLSTWNGWGKHKSPTHVPEEDDSEQAPELQHVRLCDTNILLAYFHFSKTFTFQLIFLMHLDLCLFASTNLE